MRRGIGLFPLEPRLIRAKCAPMNVATEKVLSLYRQPLLQLLHQAHEIHREHHDPADIQRCALLSIKTGGCPEDCGYCSQSAHHQTSVRATPLLTVDEVRERATRAKELGATRFCMGAAWRAAREGP